MTNKTPKRLTKTKKDYKLFYKGYNIIIPKGSIVTNQTACGPDDNYYFWDIDVNYIKKLTEYTNSLLLHDLKFYGINIPKDYCYLYDCFIRRGFIATLIDF